MNVGKFEPVPYDVFKNSFDNSQTEEKIKEYYASIAKNMPCRATSQSAGYDIYCPIDVTISPINGGVVIPLGIRSEFKAGWVLIIVPRSGLGFKYGLALDNTVAVIDSDYEGQIMLKLHSLKHLEIKAGDRIAQGIFLPFGLVDGDEIDSTLNERGTGGFGSTGK